LNTIVTLTIQKRYIGLFRIFKVKCIVHGSYLNIQSGSIHASSQVMNTIM